MIFTCRRIRTVLIILLVAIATSFCASKNFLKVNYQLPTESVELKETRVALTVKDVRENPTIVTKSATQALKNFTGHFVLNVAKENKNYKLVGAFGLISMIREIFKHRLENAGVQVVTEENIGTPIVEIVLKEFKLDLANRKWIIKMNYFSLIFMQDSGIN